jgi:uncharacterized protein GlcG (DUF336 family)
MDAPRTVTTTSISLAGARAAIAAAQAHARELGVAVCVAVVDPAGQLVAFEREEGTAPTCTELAIDKAYTAAVMGGDTDQNADFIAADDHLARSVPHVPRLRLFGGGVLLHEGDDTVGAIGVSGGYHVQDHEIARAGAGRVD